MRSADHWLGSSLTELGIHCPSVVFYTKGTRCGRCRFPAIELKAKASLIGSQWTTRRYLSRTFVAVDKDL